MFMKDLIGISPKMNREGSRVTLFTSYPSLFNNCPEVLCPFFSAEAHRSVLWAELSWGVLV